MIPFSKTPYIGSEDDFVIDAIKRGGLSGDGFYAIKCQNWFKNYLCGSKVLLTPNCTQALEMAAILIDIQPGDEVIMPSYTFVSTANAFVLRGAKIVFVDIREDTLNIDERKIEDAITSKTKAIVPVHYAGVACEMDAIMRIADKYDLYVIEDAAQAFMSKYKGRPLGSIGHIAAYSFHDTKNYTSGGEGGLLIINETDRFSDRAEVIREKGTNRCQFFRGMVDKYTWVDVGSSYLPSELQSAYLYAQLESARMINESRLNTWKYYYESLKELSIKYGFCLPYTSADSEHNAHMFYIKLEDLKQRSNFIEYMRNNGIGAVFHYIPLHSSPAGENYGYFCGVDNNTTKGSETIVRLPLWFDMPKSDVDTVVEQIRLYFEK